MPPLLDKGRLMTYYCSFFSGSSGNCSIFVHNDCRMLIDAGGTAKSICACLGRLSLTPSDLTHILITHGHRDHVSALPVLLKRTRAAVICSQEAYADIAYIGTRARRFYPGESFELGGVTVRTFETPHDAAGSCGYVLCGGEASLAYCTDLGTVSTDILDALRGCALTVIESNHDTDMLRLGSYPYFLKQRILSDRGHLSNAMCARVVAKLAESGCRRFILAHLSHENNTPQKALEASRQALLAAGLAEGVTLTAAHRFEMGEPVIF